MKVQIMGAGALGSLFGTLIQLAGFDVIFVARGKQFEALKKSLKISGLLDLTLKVNATNTPEDADITLVTVKAYDTEKVAELLRSVDPGIVCSLQNGVGNEEILAKHFDVVGGITSYAANMVNYGHINYAGEGYTFLGDINKPGLANIVASIFKKSGIRVEVVEDIEFRIWLKAAINAVINPLTAICRVKNGELLRNRYLWEIAQMIARECDEVMDKMGYSSDIISEVKKVLELTANNKSSMLQDIERGKRTEIDYINGAFFKKGKKLGIALPINVTLINLVKVISGENGH